MGRRFHMGLIAAFLVLGSSGMALAQSGEIACQTDVKRAEDLYNQKYAALTESERQQAQQLMETARTRCQAGGSGALNTRSPEAVAVLDMLEKAPMPSQATVPEQR